MDKRLLAKLTDKMGLSDVWRPGEGLMTSRLPDATEAELKLLAEFTDSDDCEMGIDDSGNPYIMFHGDEENVRRVQEIGRKLSVEGELTFMLSTSSIISFGNQDSN
jgi:hypothetical protein